MGKNGKKKFRPFEVQVGNDRDLTIACDSNDDRSSYSSANNRRQNQRDQRRDDDEQRASSGPWRTENVAPPPARGPWRSEPGSRNSDRFTPSVEGSTWGRARNETSFRADPSSRRGNDRQYSRDSLREDNDGANDESRGNNENESNEGTGEAEDTHSSVPEQAPPTVNNSWYEDTTSYDNEMASRQNKPEAYKEIPDRTTQKYVPPRSSYNSQNYNGPPSRTDSYQRQRNYEDNGGNEAATMWRQGPPRSDSNTREYRPRFNNRSETNRDGERREQPHNRNFNSAWNKRSDNSGTDDSSWRRGPSSRSTLKDSQSLDSSKNADSNDTLENSDRKGIAPENKVNSGSSLEKEDIEENSRNSPENEDWNTVPSSRTQEFKESKKNSWNPPESGERRGNTRNSFEKKDRRESSKYSKSLFFGSPSEEQERFLSYLYSKDAADFTKVKEEEQDLFSVGEDYALAHCVAEDMNMGSGIAVEFRIQFKKVADLLEQRAESGGLAFLELNGRFIYYLVTKKRSQGKPTYDTLWSSLLKLRAHMKKNNVKKLALPRIGCGLDRLDWDNVKPMLEFLFKREEVDILVCNFQPDGLNAKPLKKCKVVLEQKPITEIDPETVIIYFAAKDGKVTDNMKKLDDKFKYLAHFEKESKDLGKPVRLVPMFNKNYILYGCIVKEKLEDPFSFVSFASCLHSIVKNYKIDNYYYIAFQSEEDDLLNAKILNLMKHTLKDMDIYICGYFETPSSVEE